MGDSLKMNNDSGRQDWAEDDQPDLATALPGPKVTKNKDGTETIVTFSLNEKGQRVKRTQRIKRTVKRYTERAGVAERRKWTKFGPEAGRPAGPQADTTTMGENIIFRPIVGFKSGAAAAAAGAKQDQTPEDSKKAEALKKMAVKCRICQGEHFTARCPFKDTMAPDGEPAGEPAAMPDMGDEGGVGGLGLGGSSYVPPHLRNRPGGAAAAVGDRMGYKTERDDLATLRVTNISDLTEEQELRDIFGRFGHITRVFLAKDRETGLPKGFAFISFADRADALKAKNGLPEHGLHHLILNIDFASRKPGS